MDKFSSTDPDQDAEAFIRLIESKINFALGTEPEAGELEPAIYLFRKKKLYFLHCEEDPQPNAMGAPLKML